MLVRLIRSLIKKPLRPAMANSVDVSNTLVLAQRYRETNEPTQAVAVLEQALQFNPHDPRLNNDLGRLLLDGGEFERAQTLFRNALAQDPLLKEAHTNLGITHQERGEREAAIAHYRAALAIDPVYTFALCNLAVLYFDQGQVEEAQTCLAKVLAREPNNAEALYMQALFMLAQGDFRGGWAGYELRVRQLFPPPPSYPYPRWQGEDLNGRSVLISSEQGLGDQIMFASCIPDLINAGARCVLICKDKLNRLFAHSFPRAQITSRSNPELVKNFEPIDFVVPIASLGGHLRPNRDSFPAHDGYLQVSSQRIEAWRVRLDSLGDGLKVGIAWRGGTAVTRQDLRSIPLASWVPILRCGHTRFISLQHTDCAAELQALRMAEGLDITYWPDALHDYYETAALVSALDLVITVQTAVFHLAGALGKPVWGLISASPEWRYGLTGETIPWYPSARLIRQRGVRDWEPVLNEAAHRLTRLTQHAGIQGTFS